MVTTLRVPPATVALVIDRMLKPSHPLSLEQLDYVFVSVDLGFICGTAETLWFCATVSRVWVGTLK